MVIIMEHLHFYYIRTKWTGDMQLQVATNERRELMNYKFQVVTNNITELIINKFTGETN